MVTPYKKTYDLGNGSKVQITEDRVVTLIPSQNVVYISYKNGKDSFQRERFEDLSKVNTLLDGTEDKAPYRESLEYLYADDGVINPWYVFAVLIGAVALILAFAASSILLGIVGLSISVVVFAVGSSKNKNGSRPEFSEEEKNAALSRTSGMATAFLKDVFELSSQKSELSLLYPQLIKLLKKTRNANSQENESLLKSTEDELFTIQEKMKGCFTNCDEALAISKNINDNYTELCQAFQDLAKAQYIWNIRSERPDNTKSFGNTSVERESIKLSSGQIDGFFSAYDVPILTSRNGKKYYLYPSFVVCFVSKTNFSVTEYKNMLSKITSCSFMETEVNPTDSKLERYTYTYVNKNGGPDRRYSYNPQRPVYEYGELTVEPIGVKYLVSNYSAAREFEHKIKDYYTIMSRVNVSTTPQSGASVPQTSTEPAQKPAHADKPRPSIPLDITINGKPLPSDYDSSRRSSIHNITEEYYNDVNSAAHNLYRLVKQIGKKYKCGWGCSEDAGDPEQLLFIQVCADIARSIRKMGITLDFSKADCLPAQLFHMKMANNDELMSFDEYQVIYRQLEPQAWDAYQPIIDIAEKTPDGVYVAHILSKYLGDEDMKGRYLLLLHRLLKGVEDADNMKAPNHQYLMDIFNMREKGKSCGVNEAIGTNVPEPHREEESATLNFFGSPEQTEEGRDLSSSMPSELIQQLNDIFGETNTPSKPAKPATPAQSPIQPLRTPGEFKRFHGISTKVYEEACMSCFNLYWVVDRTIKEYSRQCKGDADALAERIHIKVIEDICKSSSIKMDYEDHFCLAIYIYQLMVHNNGQFVYYDRFLEEYKQIDGRKYNPVAINTAVEGLPNTSSVVKFLHDEFGSFEFKKEYGDKLKTTAKSILSYIIEDSSLISQLYVTTCKHIDEMMRYTHEDATHSDNPSVRFDLEKHDQLAPVEFSEGPEIVETSSATPTIRIQRVSYVTSNLRHIDVSSDLLVSGEYDGELKERLSTVIFAESPVHRSLLYKRVLNSFGISRTGQRLADYMDNIVNELGHPEIDGFIWYKGMDKSSYHIFRTGGHRSAAEISLEEAANAVRATFGTRKIYGRDDLMKDTASLLGFTRLGTNVATLMGDAINLAVNKGLIIQNNYGMLTVKDE